jgi:hypothetical protein
MLTPFLRKFLSIAFRHDFIFILQLEILGYTRVTHGATCNAILCKLGNHASSLHFANVFFTYQTAITNIIISYK